MGLCGVSAQLSALWVSGHGRYCLLYSYFVTTRTAKLHFPAFSAVKWACDWVPATSMWVEVLLPLPGLAPRPPFDFMFLLLCVSRSEMKPRELDQLWITDGKAPNRRKLGFWITTWRRAAWITMWNKSLPFQDSEILVVFVTTIRLPVEHVRKAAIIKQSIFLMNV